MYFCGKIFEQISLYIQIDIDIYICTKIKTLAFIGTNYLNDLQEQVTGKETQKVETEVRKET